MKQIPKTKRFIAVILISVMLINQFGILDLSAERAYAASSAPTSVIQKLANLLGQGGGSSHTELNIAVILAEESLLDDKTSYTTQGKNSTLREHIFAYAQNIQKRMPHTRAIVVGVKPTESTQKISAILEKLYYEGVDNDLLDSSKLNDNSTSEDDNRLSGIVLVGNVPIPVVYDEDDETAPSLYPYTDFEKKRYIYNYSTEHFELNKEAVKPTPEIWHGVIVPPSQDDKKRRQELADYFYKNNQYSTGSGDYAAFDKRLLYYNFPAVEKKMNVLDYNNYKRGIKYVEELAFQRFNRHLLREMVNEMAAETEPEKEASKRKPVIDDTSLANMTDSIAKATIQKYTNNFATALKTYLGRLNSEIEKTGRWSSKEYDSLASLITMRDSYMQNMLMAKSVELENLINKEIDGIQENISLIQDLELKSVFCLPGGIICTKKTFNFDAFIDGTRVKDMTSAEQCGLSRGQTRPKGTTVQENNSVMADINRTYNSATVVKPDGKLDEDPTFIGYGGCTANNSIKIDIDSENIHYGPAYCKSQDAAAPVFDYGGSKELKFSVYNSSDKKPSSDFELPAEQCTFNKISYLQYPSPYKGLPSYSGAEDNWEKEAYKIGVGYASIEMDLEDVIEEAYGNMVSDGKIPIIAGEIVVTAPSRLQKIAQYMFQGGSLTGSYSYKTGISTGIGIDINIVKVNTVKLTLTATKKNNIKSFARHIEPTDSAITAICSSQLTPNIPADGIRYIEFYKGGKRQYYKYPNFFKIKGENVKDVTQNLVKMVGEKDKELNQILGASKDITNKFLLSNSDLIEPLEWLNMSIDRKHQLVFDKYLNRDGYLPAPANSLPPSAKPKGYEVLHIYADGDEKEIKFGVNKSKLTKYELTDSELTSAKKSLSDSQSKAAIASASPSGSGQTTKLFSCGANDGVEIWEWFPKLISCWIPDEITKLDKLISLDNSCSSGTTTTEQKPEDKIFDEIKTTSLILDNPESKPIKLEVTTDQKTLAYGDSVDVNVKILNSKDKAATGYLDSPLTFISGDSKLITVDKTSVNVFTGEDKVKITAGNNQEGSTNLTVKLGSLSKIIPIRVIKNVSVNLAYEKQTGKPSYKITADLLDPNGKKITDINTKIQLNPANPAEGTFVQNLINIKDGTGEGIFYPNPTSAAIKITAAHPAYTGTTLSVPSIKGEPFKIVIDAPSDLEIAKSEISIPIRITDIDGVTAEKFNQPISVKITDQFKKFGSIASPNISITGGKGVVKIKTGNETGKINLVASHKDLAPGMAEMPLVAKITQEELSKTFPQNLFASFVGFPAGNFLEKDYFGGTHLFKGKTQAVFAPITDIPAIPIITIQPNYKIKTADTNQLVKVSNYGKSIGLQVIDKKTLKSLLGAVIPFNFTNVTEFKSGEKLAADTAYFELTNNNYSIEAKNNAITLLDTSKEKAALIQKDNLIFYNLNLTLSYSEGTPDGPPEFILSDSSSKIGKLYLNFKPVTLKESDFVKYESYSFRKLFSGKSTSDPTGLVLYDPTEEIADEMKPSENFGFENDTKYIPRFAGGSPVGEATMFNMPFNSVLLGDPTIYLTNKSTSSLDYDNTIGRQIYQDSEESDVMALTNFDFNNDNIEDVAAVLKDGRIRLFEGGPTDPIYKDRGNIAFLADGALSIIAFDFKNDGYDDLLVATGEGRLAILHNDKEVLTRTDQKIKVGKQLYQISKADMDADGYPDLVTLDSRGDIRIFYNQSPASSKNPVPPEDQFLENGMLLANYGLSLNSTKDLKYDLKFRYPQMPEPKDPTSTIKSQTSTGSSAGSSTGSSTGSDPWSLPQITIPKTPDTKSIKSFQTKDTSKDVSDSEGKSLVKSLADENSKAQKSGNPTGVQKLPWKEGDNKETYFMPAKDFETNNSAFKISKTASNKNRPNATDLDLGEALQYKITLTSNKNIDDFILADTIPDTLKLDTKSVKCSGGACSGMKNESRDVYLFVSNLDLKVGQAITITYDVTVKSTPKPTILIKKIDSTVKLKANAPLDNYIDILVSPPYNKTGQLAVHYSVAARSYKITETVKEQNAVSQALAQNSACIKALEALKNLKVDKNTKMDPNFMDNTMKICGMDKAQASLKSCSVDASGGSSAGGQTPEKCAKDPSSCVEDSQSSLADMLNSFACMGGGCMPVPYNMSFLTPGGVPGIAMPLISFPTTLPTPIGPLPVPSIFGLAPTPIGAADIPGPILSMIRLYMIPTLTLGMGFSFCWGPYTGQIPVPPEAFPVPYPSGNCISFALPTSLLPHCKAAEKAMTALMEAANSAISDINSGISAINNSDIPVEMDTTDEQGAGGMEISLAVNLGNASKFTPPVKGSSNKHIAPFDSIGGRIASWLDRQMLEIVNKLFTLPTIRLILPDTSQMFAGDWDEFNKVVTAWWNNVKSTTKAAESAGNSATEIGNKISSALTGTTPKDAGTSFLENYKSIETEIKNFNETTIEDLYAIVNSIPFVNLNETFIDFKIPYLSYAQIQDVIRDFEQTKLYYQKQLDKYKDLLKKYKCPDTTLSTKECIAVKVLQIFVVDIDTFIKSIEKNITVLQSYLNFPRDVILMKRQVADYLKQTACILDLFSNMIGGWLATIQNQMIEYATFYYTIANIIEQWKKLFDIFTDFDDTCDICTNERYANFGWEMLLGLVIPELPIFKFPKWPDFVIDFSNINVEVNIEMPTIHFIGEPIKLPKIPKIALPDIPDLTDLKLTAQIPPLPLLPKLPDLPKLPPLPSVPSIKLPTLPPPPKLPDIGTELNVVIELVELILKSWCLVKKALAPVPEGYIGDHMALLTNRPAYLIPLDILIPKTADIGLMETNFNELRIETTVYLGIRLKAVLEKVQEAADYWNTKIPTDWSDLIDQSITKAASTALKGIEDIIDKMEKGIKTAVSTVEEAWESNVQDELKSWGMTMQEFDQKYFRSAEADMKDLSDKATAAMGDWSKTANQHMTNSIAEMNKELKDWGSEAAKSIQEALSNTFLQWISEGAKNTDYKSWFQKKALDEISKKFSNPATTSVFKTADDCKKEFNKWSDGPQWMQDLAKEAQKKVCAAQSSSTSSQSYVTPTISKTKTQSGMQKQFAKIIETINKANQKKYVDYKTLQKKYNIPDYRIMPQPTVVDKIKSIRKNLVARGEEFNKSANSTGKDLMALADEVAPNTPFKLAGEENSLSGYTQKVATSSALSTQLLAQTLQALSTTQTTAPQSASGTSGSSAQASPSQSSGVCVGTCLVDPKTGKSVQFIPHSDNPATVKTVFISAGIKGHSHVIYSDGPNLYLKRDLSVPLDITSNIAPNVPNIIFSPDDFISSGGTVMPTKEATNMLSSVLTENGSANFAWQKSTNENLYGYGIEMEKSIQGYDSDRQNNQLADTKIVLLPPNTDNSPPRVTVGDKAIQYGTLVTSLTDEKEARKKFGIKAKTTVTGASSVLFRTITSGGKDMGITVNANQAVYFDKYSGPGYRMDMENGFYHIKMTWFDKTGRTANYNHNELLAPQIYAKTAPPMDIAFDKTFQIPVYKKGKINASEIFTDLSGTYQYYWDMDQDGLPESTGSALTIPEQKEPKEFYVDLIASANMQDTTLTRYKKQFKVSVYAPKISLDENSLKSKNTVKGTMKALEKSHDLSDIPFSVFRKRWGIWKNLGLLKKKANTLTTPALGDKNNFKDNYYSINANGDYSIVGFTTGSSNIVVSDTSGNNIAKLHKETGQIELLSKDYELRVLQASATLPTRVAIVKKGTIVIASNIYYAADSNTDVTILDKPLDSTNIPSLGVAVGDTNAKDSIIAKNIPGSAESFPGGAAIFDKTAQTNIALIDTDGDIRMMQSGYSLRVKNEGKLKEKIIFEIVDSSKQSIFDVYIAADFDKLNIRQNEIWSTLDDTKTKLAGAIDSAQVTKPALLSLPFADVKSSDPYFNAILNLYNRGIVQGYSDGYFRPGNKLTRAEFVKIALGATHCMNCTQPTDAQKTKYSAKSFPDVNLADWYHYCVSIAKDLKMVTGYGDGYFRPSQNISRAEAAAVLLRQTGVVLEKAPKGRFVDVPDYAWYADYVYAAVKIGLIKEKTGYTYPNEEITRGEFSFMSDVVLKLKDCRLTDSDNDGMTDSCEMQYNLNPLYAGDANLDNDNDNFTNLEECKNGTDPNKADHISKRCPYINNPNQNDTDKDGIIDPCDDDIDNDGIKNVIGLFDSNGFIDPKQAALSKDNCIFVANADQKDADKDGAGDVCKPVDQCPEIPEDMDGVNDLDGCPEVAGKGKSNSPGVYINKGPLCQFLDYEADFVKDDIIMTAITDVITHDIIYSKSEEVTY